MIGLCFKLSKLICSWVEVFDAINAACCARFKRRDFRFPRDERDEVVDDDDADESEDEAVDDPIEELSDSEADDESEDEDVSVSDDIDVEEC